MGIFKRYISIVFLIFPLCAIAEGRDTAEMPFDTLKAFAAKSVNYTSNYKIADSIMSSIEDEAEAILHVENAFIKKNDRKGLLSFLKIFKANTERREKRFERKVYRSLSSIFARLRMYPLAIKSYCKAEENSSLSIATDSVNIASGIEGTTLKERVCFAASDTLLTDNYKRDTPSPTTSADDIITTFNDGKTAIGYAMMLHVKQPVTGRRNIFVGLNKVGHMFITLIKFNIDSTQVSRSFGFYPAKGKLLSATPLHPNDKGALKDDANHDWDESIGRSLSSERFNRIIKLVRRYSKRRYNLNKNNCTDFGLAVAAVAGIHINGTKGHWPLGRGNNPACAGQSILEGAFANMDTDNINGLLVCTDLLGK